VLCAAADGLALAGVNGAILAIVGAGLFGYFFLAYQGLDRMETELIEEANGINRGVPLRWGGMSRTPDQTEGLDSTQLERVFALLARDFSKSPWDTVAYELPSQGDFAARGPHLTAVMEALTRRYPFVGEGDGRSYPPLPLGTVAAVREWLPRLELAAGVLEDDLDGNRVTLQKLVVAADEESSKAIDPAFKLLAARGEPGLAEDLNIMQHRNGLALDRFRDDVERWSRIAAATRTRLDALDRYRARFPSRSFIFVATAVVVVTFVCGVAIPMVHPSVSSIVDAWVPAVLYTLSLVYGAFRIIGGYRRAA
jgi:hypothetical protein